MSVLLTLSDQLRGIDPSALDAVVGPVLLGHGVELVDATFRNERGWILRFSLDAALPVESTTPTPVAAAESATPAVSAEAVLGAANVDPLRPAAAAITLAAIAEVARDLSAALDLVPDLVPHRYTLEVGSPGPDRPLRSVADLRRFVGHLAKVYLAHPAPDGQNVLRGRLLAASADTVTVEVDGKPISAPLADVTRAHLIFGLFEAPGAEQRSRGRGPAAKRNGQTRAFVGTEPQAKEER